MMDYGFRVGIAGSIRPGTDGALTFEMSLRRLLGCSCVNQLRHKLLEASSTPFFNQNHHILPPFFSTFSAAEKRLFSN